MDKDDLGTIIGGSLGGIAALASGLSAGLAVAVAVGSAYVGHKLTESHHYSPRYYYNR